MKYIYYLYAVLTVFVISCSNDDNANLPDDVRKVNIPLVTKSSNSQTNINFSEVASFKGDFMVDYYFKDGLKPEKADVVIMKNNDKSKVKIFQSGVTTFPSSFSINTSGIETLFGESIKLGDSYQIGLDLYQNNVKYEAFPTIGNAYGTAFTNLPSSSLTIKYDAVCPFNIENFYGDFEVVSDDWQDYLVGDVIKVSKVSDKAVSFNYNCSNPTPIVLNINTTTLAISGDKIQYCSYPLPAITKFYGDVVEGSKSFVDNCAKQISVRILHSDENGAVYGEGTIVLKKK